MQYHCGANGVKQVVLAPLWRRRGRHHRKQRAILILVLIKAGHAQVLL